MNKETPSPAAAKKMNLCAIADRIAPQGWDDKPLECPKLRQEFEKHLPHVEITCVDDLYQVDRLLDGLTLHELNHTGNYKALLAKARAFLEANPQALMFRWFVTESPVYDLTNEIRGYSIPLEDAVDDDAVPPWRSGTCVLH